MSTNTSLRSRRDKRKKDEGRRSMLIWGGVVVIGIALISYLVWVSLRPAEGQEFEIMAADHIRETDALPEYNSNPPTSGAHYVDGLDRGFYDLNDLDGITGAPVGHLVHNLEHGYIVFWYNCDLLNNEDCENLKSELSSYLDNSLVAKLIAIPWTGTQFPIVLTSWGYMLEMEEFSARQATAFVNANRLKAPEPNAP